ncbi:MAG: hypothetical protein QF440_03090 [Candidatus Thalassarchaeaceae archaeon]|jgi:hypothetical protein|nr:hypothetical protein [Candidatus Thalassarchaeaceae archaeon]
MADEDIEEGMFTLVGDPENPDLQVAEEEKLSLTDRIARIVKETVDGDFEVSEEERELAEIALERARSVASQVTPMRVVLASVFMAALLFSMFAVSFWVVPRDAVTVEVVYRQGGPGQVVLLQVHNYGSRPIANVAVDIEFSDADGNLLNSTHFEQSSIKAHTSIAGDGLELIVTGVSSWELYILEITLDYDNYDGALEEQVWTLEVGNYVFETHDLEADRHWF